MNETKNNPMANVGNKLPLCNDNLGICDNTGVEDYIA